MLSSADLYMYGKADFIFQQNMALTHNAKNCFLTRLLLCLIGLANLSDLNLKKRYKKRKRKTGDTKPTMQMIRRQVMIAVKETWASMTPIQCHMLIAYHSALMQ